ncbi:MAG: EAL domain-containing protein [Chitinispirillales bacterium]|jgi:diguanylate cyclase (GGDEF)-like protein/PAS domain S-box-containing protein|nr:EAL domain-containing protein [Chitinispirillales bacterium]
MDKADKKQRLQKSVAKPKTAEKTKIKSKLRPQLHLGENAFYDIFFKNAPEAILITDSADKILLVNKSFVGVTGYKRPEVIGKKPSMFRSGLHDNDFYSKMWRSLTHKGNWKGEIWNKRKNGEVYREWLSISSLRNRKGQITNYIGIFADAATNFAQSTDSFSKQYYDPLTKLPNRLLLQDRLEFMINHARRNNELMALLLIDLDRFKLVNETFGYDAGDTLLKAMTDRLITCVRDVDAVFRLGADVFAIILEEIAQLEDAAKVAKRILESCTVPLKIDGHEVYIALSIGISIFPTDGDGKVPLLQSAETAMRRAKEMGSNNFQHYKPAMNTRAAEQLALESSLRNALSREEMHVFYQPQIALNTNRIVGMEALIRWKHPEMGMIPPGQFIPVAEATGLILPIGEWVLRNACKQAVEWQKNHEPIVISVNLSARQFIQQDLVEVVRNVLKETGLPPAFLELEITESLGMKNPEQTLKTLIDLKAMGVRIAIDDFGTGYSSLSYLKRFPIDTLKIDRSFVMDMPEDQSDAEIVKTIIALAHSLRLTLIAEGVEKESQAQYLLENGCEKIQGYLFSPPVPAEEFLRLLKRQGDIIAAT